MLKSGLALRAPQAGGTGSGGRSAELLCGCREQPCRGIRYAEDLSFGFVSPQDVSVKSQCLCQLVAYLGLFSVEVRWEVPPFFFLVLLLPLTYSEDIYQLTTMFETELLITSDN